MTGSGCAGFIHGRQTFTVRQSSSALECKHIAFDTPDPALHGTGDVRIIGGTARRLRRGG
jgi:hypothetical protein